MPKQKVVNRFSKGMIKDVDKLYTPNDAYIESYNGRLLSTGEGNYSWENIEGNKFSFNFPGSSCQKKQYKIVWKFDYEAWKTYNGGDPNKYVIADLKIWATRIGMVNIRFVWGPQQGDFNLTKDQVYDRMAAKIGDKGYYADAGFKYLWFGATHPSGTEDIILSIADNKVLCIDYTITGIDVEKDGTTPEGFVGSMTAIEIQAFIPEIKSESILPLSSVSLRDKLIILTMIEGTKIGQVWEIELFEDGQPKSDPELRYYSDELNFSKQVPIEIRAIRETPGKEKIIFTDNINPPRILNLASKKVTTDGLITEPATNLEIVPQVNPPDIHITATSPGSLLSGRYFYLVRLLTNEGARSAFTICSRGIDVFFEATNSNIHQREGSPAGIQTSLAVRMKVNNIDLRYDKIQIIAIYSTDKDIIQDAYVFAELNITGSSMLLDHRISSGISGYSLDEINTRLANIRKAKVIEVMKSFLLFGNVTMDSNFQYNASQLTISDFFDGKTALPIGNQYGIKTNPPMIDYIRTTFPAHDTNPSKNYSDEKRELFFEYKNFAEPKISHWYTGYFRNETYRFGIVFFDKAGHPGFVHHIKDHKFGPQRNTNSQLSNAGGNAGWVGGSKIENPDTNPVFSFQTETNIGAYNSGTLCLNNLGARIDNIKITKDQKKKISGFSIVRAKRDEQILGQGFLWPLLVDQVDTEFSRPADYLDINKNKRPYWFLFHAPDLQFKDISFVTGDMIELTNLFSALKEEWQTTSTPSINTGVVDGNRYATFNRESDLPELGNWHNQRYKIKKVYKVSRHDTIGGYDPGDTSLTYENLTKISVNNSNKDGTFQNTWLISVEAGFKEISSLFNIIESKGSFGKFTANYIRPKNQPYGGSGVESMANTQYFSTGHYQRVPDDGKDTVFNAFIYGGDCFMNYYDTTVIIPNGELNASVRNSISIFIPIESNLNLNLREGRRFYKHGIWDAFSGGGNAMANGISDGFGSDPYQPEEYNYSNYLSSDNPGQIFLGKPVNYVDNDVFDTRWAYAGPKIDGELIDSFREFKVNNFLDLPGVYGAVHAGLEFNGRLYSLQKNAVCWISINERSLVQDTSGVSLVLGSGTVMDRYDYISTEIGTSHQRSLIKTNNAFYFYDEEKKKIYRFGYDGLSPLPDMKEFESFLFKTNKTFFDNKFDNPVSPFFSGIHGVYDYRFNELLMTFKPFYLIFNDLVDSGIGGVRLNHIIEHNGRFYKVIVQDIPITGGTKFEDIKNDLEETKIDAFTVCYNEKIKNFTGFYTFVPLLYIKHRDIILTANPHSKKRGEFYAHGRGANRGEFYGQKHESILKFVVNHLPETPKVFDNCSINMEGENDIPLTEGNFTTHANGTVNIKLNPQINGLVKFRERYYRFPSRNSANGSPRLRDKAMEVELIYDNILNKKINIFGVETTIRKSRKS